MQETRHKSTVRYKGYMLLTDNRQMCDPCQYVVKFNNSMSGTILYSIFIIILLLYPCRPLRTSTIMNVFFFPLKILERGKDNITVTSHCFTSHGRHGKFPDTACGGVEAVFSKVQNSHFFCTLDLCTS